MTPRRLLGALSATCVAVALVPLGLASAGPAAAQAPSTSGWSAIAGRLPARHGGEPLKSGSLKSSPFRLEIGSLTAALVGAPLENTAAARGTLPTIALPGIDGALHQFSFVSSPVMEAPLAAQVPFVSFAATAVGDSTTTARFDYSPTLGFHATVRSPEGSWNVDPAYDGQVTTYVAHAGDVIADAPTQKMNDEVGQARVAAEAKASPDSLPTPGGPVTLRTYRLALANDPGYATLVGTANVDAIKAAIVNRVDEVYNDDLAIKLVLIGTNSALNFDTQAKFLAAGYAPIPGDDLTKCTGEKIDQTATVLNAVVGVNNYDVGHILDPGGNGGIASLEAVGKHDLKGSGCSGAGNGNSDFLAVEFFSHELGHQFGATHTFSSSSCGSYTNSTAVEPGSGATIMSYAGTCSRNPDDNIQDPSDPYFSQTSIKQIQDYINSDITADYPGETPGGTPTVTTNLAPVVTAPAPSFIPVRTPFTLTGTVTDSAQTPVNVWEQIDLGAIRPLQDQNKTDGPLFRIFSQGAISPTYGSVYNAPGLNEATAAGSTRTFPDMPQIAAGNTNAAAGTCPTPAITQVMIECFAEFLPTSARTMHFDLTARDRAVGGGGTITAETTVTVSGTTPFAVTPPVLPLPGVAGGPYPVTWNVAGTTAAPFNVANVKISYSTDGGLTFPTVLAASVPNNGTALVTLPGTSTTTGRFKVEAIGQPFFDISHTDLTVTLDLTPPDTSITAGPADGSTITTGDTSFSFTSTEAGTFECKLDAGSFAACTTPKALTALANGSHTFSVRAIDAAANPDPTPATSTFTVAVPDTTPPDTSITAGPADGSTITTADTSFSFTSTEAGTFECKLDAAAFAACTSPKALTALANGSHTFSVRAIDLASNVDASPATSTFTVAVPDTTPPDTTITAGPADGSTITTASTSFSFTSTEAGTFECKLDAAAYAVCTSPKALTGLANGSHTFSVRAKDGSGNTDASPATRTFTVNTTAPAATVFRPVLTATPAKITTDRRGFFTVTISCAPVDPSATAPATCSGTVTVMAGTRKVSSASFNLTGGKSGQIKLRAKRGTRRLLDQGLVQATLSAVVGTQTVSQPLTLKRAKKKS